MKITHLVIEDITGGAGRAAYRLNESLNNNGIDSKMLVMKKSSSNDTINKIDINKWLYTKMCS